MSGDVARFGVGGFRATSAILNFCSNGGVQVSSLQATAANNSREILSGALVAGVLSELLSATGGGEIGYLSVYAKDTTSRTLAIQVIADGVEVFTPNYSSAISTVNNGLLVVGMLPSSVTNYVGTSIPLRWTQSLSVKVKSNLSETDKLAIAFNMHKV